jgi:hypothetical protein
MKAQESTVSGSSSTPRLRSNSPALATANRRAFARCLVFGQADMTALREKASTSSGNKRDRLRMSTAVTGYSPVAAQLSDTQATSAATASGDSGRAKRNP